MRSFTAANIQQVKFSLEAAELTLRNASLGIYDASSGKMFPTWFLALASVKFSLCCIAE